MALSAFERSIVRTLAFFDLLDYPLTATEVWMWLYRPETAGTDLSLAAVREALENNVVLTAIISRREGFYCLQGREDLIPLRKQRNNRVDDQIRLVRRIVKLLRLIPAIRMIAIASSLSFGNVKSNSDIDLFIITKKNQIWLARLLAAGLLKVLRQRPEPHVSKDRFCLSFFVTDDALNVEKASYGPDDIAFHYYIQSFMAVYDPDSLFSLFLKANAWLKKFIPNGFFERQLVSMIDRPRWVRLWHSFFTVVTWPLFFGFNEDWYCDFQLRILPPQLKTIANIDSRVIISDRMLKFHDKDNRHALTRKWHERCAAYE